MFSQPRISNILIFLREYNDLKKSHNKNESNSQGLLLTSYKTIYSFNKLKLVNNILEMSKGVAFFAIILSQMSKNIKIINIKKKRVVLDD